MKKVKRFSKKKANKTKNERAEPALSLTFVKHRKFHPFQIPNSISETEPKDRGPGRSTAEERTVSVGGRGCG